ncbi:helix-turn-helix domain-containing protein [Photorhabdus sp. SF281]|uniref:helix-turn-helix domain-containing protein n=1 Tax=Photorhabdus sp. SF281 TaxID=3459527 RepID=UPI004043CE61
MKTPLRKIRIEKGLTISEVSKATSVDIGNLSRIERGIQSPSLDTAEKLSRYFKGEINEMQILYPKRYMTDAIHIVQQY